MSKSEGGSRPSGATTHEVARLYDEHPYPNHGVVSDVVARMLQPTVDDLRSRVPKGALRILDAGCGTGEQALGLARRFPDIEVVGIDFNRKSIERAKVLARRHDLPVTFEQGNLLEDLTRFGEFGLIVCVGVLHHLDEPAAALRQLRNVSVEDARLLGMVYGTFGRQRDFDLRDALGLLSEDASRDEILGYLHDLRPAARRPWQRFAEEFLRRRRFGPELPVLEALRRLRTRSGPTYQADAYTHAREHSFTFEEVARLLGDTGWQFHGWPKRSGMPDRPGDLFRERTAVSLEGRSPLDAAAVYERILRPANLFFLATGRGTTRTSSAERPRSARGNPHSPLS